MTRRVRFGAVMKALGVQRMPSIGETPCSNDDDFLQNSPSCLADSSKGAASTTSPIVALT